MNRSGEENEGFITVLNKYFPGSMALAILLSISVLIISLASLDIIKALELLSTGFFDHLSLQMALILWWVLPVVIIESERFGLIIDKLSNLVPLNQKIIILTTASLSIFLGWINWALGFLTSILVGQKLIKEANEKGKNFSYSSTVFASFLGFITGNIGLTSPAALITTQEFLYTSDLSLMDYVFDQTTILILLATLIGAPLILLILAKDEKESINKKDLYIQTTVKEKLSHYEVPPREEWLPAEKLEYSPILSIIAFILGIISLTWIWNTTQITMLNILFALMIFGLISQKNPMAFMEKARDSTKWVTHLAIPFILYAGTYSLLTESGAYVLITNLIQNIPISGGYIISFLLGIVVPDPGSVWLLTNSIFSQILSLTESMNIVMIASGTSNIWLAFIFAKIIGIEEFNWKKYIKYALTISIYVSLATLTILVLF